MDENEFRAEIAEIFREQDRRFDRAQKRMEETDAKIEKLNASLEKTARIADANAKAINKNNAAINKNAKAIDKLSGLWGDFVDVYRFREQQTEDTLSNLSAKISEIDKSYPLAGARTSGKIT